MLHHDPLNVIITGVGGQGNVLASQIIGQGLLQKGFKVTVGETYGLSQRGGAVMSHIRISEKDRMGPIIPEGLAHVVLGLEPVEALRVLGPYGNRDVTTIVNARPVYPLGVIAGEIEYPDLHEVKKTLEVLSKQVFWVEATDIAVELGHAIMTNVVMMGALMGTGLLPVTKEELLPVLSETLPPRRLNQNIEAFNRGLEAVFSLALHAH
jgi:indolepyruvate ferredoxin oxidoreductase beta subunit